MATCASTIDFAAFDAGCNPSTHTKAALTSLAVSAREAVQTKALSIFVVTARARACNNRKMSVYIVLALATRENQGVCVKKSFGRWTSFGVVNK